MDDLVKAALAKWPNVPACHDWLALDARGDWFMRDERTQRAGPFPQSKGSPVRHDKLRAFIHRNYEADPQGAWYFQNGPQRVYVTLEAAPLVWRVDAQGGVQAHTGEPAVVSGAWVDESGRLFLAAERGFGIVHPQDMVHAADALERGDWPLAELPFAEMPARFGYQLHPQP